MSRQIEGPRSTHSFSKVFSVALRGHPCHVVGLNHDPEPLPIREWRGTADRSDRAVLAHCVGATLDIGCGPGRMSAHLAGSGQMALGIDVVQEAVVQARERGVAALVRDIFEALPGEGRWETALLADGNVGIGGDPVALLARSREVIAPDGRIVVDLSPPGVGVQTRWALLRCAGTDSRPFRWARVGVDAVESVAVQAGLAVLGTHRCGDRWFSVLHRGSAR